MRKNEMEKQNRNGESSMRREAAGVSLSISLSLLSFFELNFCSFARVCFRERKERGEKKKKQKTHRWEQEGKMKGKGENKKVQT